MSDHINLKARREKLEAERVRLHERSQRERDKLHDPAATEPDPLDVAQNYTSRARTSALLDLLAQRELEHIVAALQRMDDGAYGQCARCGRTINPERLDVLPQALLCMTCQRLQDKASE